MGPKKGFFFSAGKWRRWELWSEGPLHVQDVKSWFQTLSHERAEFVLSSNKSIRQQTTNNKLQKKLEESRTSVTWFGDTPVLPAIKEHFALASTRGPLSRPPDIDRYLVPNHPSSSSRCCWNWITWGLRTSSECLHDYTLLRSSHSMGPT